MPFLEISKLPPEKKCRIRKTMAAIVEDFVRPLTFQ